MWLEQRTQIIQTTQPTFDAKSVYNKNRGTGSTTEWINILGFFAKNMGDPYYEPTIVVHDIQDCKYVFFKQHSVTYF